MAKVKSTYLQEQGEWHVLGPDAHMLRFQEVSGLRGPEPSLSWGGLVAASEPRGRWVRPGSPGQMVAEYNLQYHLQRVDHLEERGCCI